MSKGIIRIINIAIILLFMLTVIAGCGKSNNEPSGNAPEESVEKQGKEPAKEPQKVVLTLRHIEADETTIEVANLIKDAADRFMKDNPNASVQIEAVDHDTHRAKLKAEMAGGTPPDLFFTWGYSFSEPFYKAGKLLDISELLNSDPQWKSGFLPGTLEAFHYGDGYYGIPRDGFAEGIFYNKEIFSSMGITPPKTFDELKDMVNKIKQANIIPIAIGNKEKWPSTFIHNYFFDRQAGYDVYKKLMNRESEVSWVNEDYIKGNEKVQELVKLGAFPKGASAITRNEGMALFYQGKAAMFIDGTWCTTNFSSNEAPQGFIDKIGFINFPSFTDGKGNQNVIVAGFTSGFCISSEVKGGKAEYGTKAFRTGIFYPALACRSEDRNFLCAGRKLLAAYRSYNDYSACGDKKHSCTII